MSAPLPIYDLNALRGVVDERVLRRGMAYFREDRVFDFTGGPVVSATVEGVLSGTNYAVQISEGEDRALTGSCTCGEAGEGLCKHMVAVLLTWATRAPAYLGLRLVQ